MARICDICGKGPRTGNHVSKSNNRKHRRWLPNLQNVRAQVGKTVKRLRVCTGCIRRGRVAKAV